MLKQLKEQGKMNFESQSSIQRILKTEDYKFEPLYIQLKMGGHVEYNFNVLLILKRLVKRYWKVVASRPKMVAKHAKIHYIYGTFFNLIAFA